MAHDELIEQLRHPYAEIAGMVADEAADLIEQQAARIAKLEAAGDALGSIPGHGFVCDWEDGAPCTCGYSKVAEGWAKARAALEREQ